MEEREREKKMGEKAVGERARKVSNATSALSTREYFIGDTKNCSVSREQQDVTD